MAKIKVVIIEDEKPARDLVKNYLSTFDEVELVGEFDNGFTGLKGINELKPHAVFLDVQMPKLTGFEMLELLDYQPEIVFTTAYDQFAIDAFERNAVDYLLKPFSKDRFNEAMQKLFERIEKSEGQDDPINRIKQHIEDSSDTIHRVVIKKSGKIHVISTEKIDYIEAQDDYVMIYSGEGRFLKQQTMKYFEKHLDNEMFMRVHRSYIVNVQSIDRIEPYEKTNYIISLKSGGKVPVSRNGMQGLKEKLNF
ncbi:MAG TPA: LytTR family transcriptional regulator DNA-binding domain-containing protein [Bacteroidales bacterium]|nr:LytTR family transcriptional regulator DNA-binding domain-containing protein [Bacteroidales bacterium]